MKMDRSKKENPVKEATQKAHVINKLKLKHKNEEKKGKKNQLLQLDHLAGLQIRMLRVLFSTDLGIQIHVVSLVNRFFFNEHFSWNFLIVRRIQIT